MILYRPLKQSLISQGFGIKNTKPEMLGKYQAMGLLAHNGYDFPCPLGEPILWNGYDIEGKVVKLSTEVNEGLGVTVITEDKDGIFQHIFWHLKEIKCQVGQILNSGDLIGLADTTGFSTGNHLHWGLKELRKNDLRQYVVKNPDNGYFGSIDPTTFFRNIFIGDTLLIMEGRLNIIKKILNSLLAKVGYKIIVFNEYGRRI